MSRAHAFLLRAPLTGGRAPSATVGRRCLTLLFTLIFFVAPAASQVESGREARRKVVTNKDLEAFRQKRLNEEAAYERERAGRGLPSKEELRRRAEEQDRRFIEFARQLEAARAAEEYEQLRNEVSSLQARAGLYGATQQPQPYVDYAGYASYPFYYPFPFITTGVRQWSGFRIRLGGRQTLSQFPFRRASSPFHQRGPFVGRGPWPAPPPTQWGRPGQRPGMTGGFRVNGPPLAPRRGGAGRR